MAIITTCMGRLEHIKETSAKLMADPRVGKEIIWVVVDFCCPQNTGEWLKKEYGDRVRVVNLGSNEEEASTPLFNKSLALNTGACEAIFKEDPEYLAFIDADTLVEPTFIDFLIDSASPDSFSIFEVAEGNEDLTGFICLSQRNFLLSEGFDIKFEGWGAEDLDFRLNLFLKLGLNYFEMPYSLAKSISHDDSVRTENYLKTDKNKSHDKNMNILCSNVFDWTGEHILDLYSKSKGGEIRRLLGIEAINPREIK